MKNLKTGFGIIPDCVSIVPPLWQRYKNILHDFLEKKNHVFGENGADYFKNQCYRHCPKMSGANFCFVISVSEMTKQVLGNHYPFRHN
jgi:hypothetical protein